MGSSGFIKPLLQNAWIEPLPALTTLLKLLTSTPWNTTSKQEAWAVLKTLRMLQAISWEQLQSSKGLRWELIQSRQGPAGQRLFSLRITRSCRAVAWRNGTWLRLLSLHPDHDSTYK